MYQFPKDLYTDIRLETVFSTEIKLEDFLVTQKKSKREMGAMIRIFDGNRWYYSATTDIKNLQKQIDALAEMAVPNKLILEHPIVKSLEVNKDVCFKYKDKDFFKIDTAKKLEVLENYIPVIREFDQLKMQKLYYGDRHVIKHIISSKGTDVEFDTQYAGIAIRYMQNYNQIPHQGFFNYTAVELEELFEKKEDLKKTILKDISYCEKAVPVIPGEYTCVLSPGATGIFAHESFGHKSEADFMIGDEVMKKEWVIGRKVGAKELNIMDCGLMEGVGYVPYDDEGCKARVNYLIKDGFLKGRLHSASTASGLNEEVTGNARALNFEYEPLVRMTNTYVGRGDKTKEELIGGVKEGIYIDDIRHGSGMTTFTIAPLRAYMIREGKLAEPVRISVISGNVMSTLYDIDGISKDFEMAGTVRGGCGKLDQWPLPVSFGGPYIRVNKIHVQ